MAASEPRHAPPLIVSAHGDRLRDKGGREYIDLSMGYGSVWLGHNHPVVQRAVASQLEQYAAPGYLPTTIQDAARTAFARFIPETHFLGGIYSTGMEAMESALRAACVHTGRAEIAGFSGSEHGRSFVTAAVGGTPSPASLEFVHCLPSFAEERTGRLETELRELARRVELAAIVVEPIQMTGGGHEIPRSLCDAIFEIARDRSVPVVFDETLTGFFRCGSRFYFESTGRVPDIFVVGKGMASGFPAAAVVLRKGMAWDRARVRPGSTFWNHPLACAAVAATLDELSKLDAVRKVGEIESTVRQSFATQELRGRGAMWCLGVPRADGLAELASRLLGAGLVVSYYDRYVRLLPPLTIALDTLASACNSIRKAHADTFG